MSTYVHQPTFPHYSVLVWSNVLASYHCTWVAIYSKQRTLLNDKLNDKPPKTLLRGFLLPTISQIYPQPQLSQHIHELSFEFFLCWLVYNILLKMKWPCSKILGVYCDFTIGSCQKCYTASFPTTGRSNNLVIWPRRCLYLSLDFPSSGLYPTLTAFNHLVCGSYYYSLIWNIWISESKGTYPDILGPSSLVVCLWGRVWTWARQLSSDDNKSRKGLVAKISWWITFELLGKNTCPKTEIWVEEHSIEFITLRIRV